jgi:hypothetical protein
MDLHEVMDGRCEHMSIARTLIAGAFAAALLMVIAVYTLDNLSFTEASAEDEATTPPQGAFIGPGEGSTAQDKALADGMVTFEEYEAAIWATFHCIAGAGYEPMMEPTLDASGRVLQYAFFSHGGDSTQSAVARRCRDEHSTLVDIAWAVANTPTESVKQVARQATEACLVAAGFPEETVTSASRPEPLIEHDPATFFRCADATAAEFGIRGGGF